MAIEFSIKYFTEPEGDGNLSLQSTEARIKDACLLLESDKSILLTDLKKTVTTEKELRTIIENHQN